jgi:hypothetical protein
MQHSKGKARAGANGNCVTEFPKKRLLEIIYFPIFIMVFFAFQLKIKPEFADKELAETTEFVVIAVTFGLLHILASNILSYLYNLQRCIMPLRLVPLATSKRLKVLGSLTIVIGIALGIARIVGL